MDPSHILEALGITGLGSMSCNDLGDRIKQASSKKVPRRHILATLMGWLHEKIKEDIVTQQPSMLQDFVDLLTMPDALGIMPFSQSEINLAFSEWKERDAKQNPANRRRYLMARLDLNKLLERARSGSQLENNPPSSGSPGQAESGECLAFSCNTTPSPFMSEAQDKESNDYELKVGKKKTGANVIPLGTRKPLRAATNQEVIDICDDDDSDQQTDAPASSGSDLDEVKITRETILLDSTPEKMIKNSERRRSSKQRYSLKHHVGNGSNFSIPPPVNYVCNRCSKPGSVNGLPLDRKLPSREITTNGALRVPWTDTAKVAMTSIDQIIAPELGMMSALDVLDDQSRSSSPLRRRRDSRTLSVKVGSLRLMRDSDIHRDGESREGRLAYDDEIDVFTEPGLSLQAPTKKDALEPIESVNRDASMKDASPIIDGTSDDMERAKREADAFLDALGMEIMASEKSYAMDDPMNTDEIQSAIDGYNILDGPDTSISEKPDGSKVRRIEDPQVQEEVDILFTGRDNHVVHGRASRKRACVMIDSPK
ncbi:hypothetical protein F4809DRAFT_662308 [Biscogniauxia mediterranea]|nr:hypothetical protein F4809DRAFT_662308 [Biscogniauxia mediterranea]